MNLYHFGFARLSRTNCRLLALKRARLRITILFSAALSHFFGTHILEVCKNFSGIAFSHNFVPWLLCQKH